MPETSVFIPLVFLYGTIICVLFALSVFVFMLHYQNKMLQHEREINAKDEERERLVVQSLMQGQENEQERLGLEMHDSGGMDLLRIKMILFEVRIDMEQHSLDTTQLEQARNAVTELIDNIRNLSHTMIPDCIIRNGLVWSVNETVTLLTEGKIAKVVLHAEEVDTFLDDSNKLMLFRVIQELTQNAIKHAKANVVSIEIMRNQAKQVVVKVSDTGLGFNPDELETTMGVGLRNVKSRVRVAGGEFNLKTAPGFGTVATITV